MNVKKILEEATINSASDIWVIAGRPLSYKHNGTIQTLNEIIMSPRDTYEFITAIYTYAKRDIAYFDQCGDDSFSFTLPRFSRYRVSAYKQRNSYAAVLHAIPLEVPEAQYLKMPETISELSKLKSGLVLVTGPDGSGKTTTISYILDRINHERSGHIITIEEPMEYLHPHIQCIVSQRELPADSESYPTAVTHALRQRPDVLMLGEMPDIETIQAVITAAESQKLVLSSMHTSGVSETIDHLIHKIPNSCQQYFSVQLASVLRAVISQKLLPSIYGRLVPAFEIMIMDSSIHNLICSGRVSQIDEMIHTSSSDNLVSMDTSIFRLYEQDIIYAETAISEAADPIQMKKRIYPESGTTESTD